jgi:hypothetical protein
VNRPKAPSWLWLLLVPALLSLVLVAWGIVLAAKGQDRLILGVGCLGVVACFLTLGRWLESAAQTSATLDHISQLFIPIRELMQRMDAALHRLGEQQLISERAKEISFRTKEREALRQAIREEISRRDWEGAIRLVEEMEKEFGYKQEAETCRQEIFQEREAETRKVIAEGLAVIDQHCHGEQWALAKDEAERLRNLFPLDAQAARLPGEIEARRQEFKKQLRQTWEDAVTRHDVDGSIEILRKMDQYLTSLEARELQEAVRQVFKDKLLSLGQQFTLAVKDRGWAEAARLGELIISEFPNSRMATEVREKIELLHQRAGEEQAVPA